MKAGRLILMRSLGVAAAVSVTGTAAPCAAQNIETIGAFRYLARIDGITDVDRSVVFTSAVNAEGDVEGHIAWRCNQGHVEVFLRTTGDLGGDSLAVQWRVDQRPAPEGTHWLPSNSGMTVFAPQADAERLTHEALTALRMLVRVVDPNGRPLDFLFRMEQAERAIGSLACVDAAGSGH